MPSVAVLPGGLYYQPGMIELLTLGRVCLVSSDGADAGVSGVQPKRMALLAFLAVETTKGPVGRDTLLALFWPELGEEEARRALRQGLHHLRRAVGEDVIVTSGDMLSLQSDRFRCDAVAFEALVGAGNVEEALDLYRGDFFDGFHVDDVAAEFEEWVWRTTSRLKRRASSAAWSAASAAASVGTFEEAITLGRRACALDPDQEAGWRRLMMLQADAGDRLGALRTYQDLTERIARELDAEPDAETTALARRIRTMEPTPRVPLVHPTAAAAVESPHTSGAPTAHPVVATAAPARGTRPRPRVAWALGAGAMIGLLAVARPWMTTRDAPSLLDTQAIHPRDRIVVADFASFAVDSTLTAGVTEAFRVDLTQSPNVRVLTGPQVASALARMSRPADTTLSDVLARELAQREGAKAVVRGSVLNAGGAFTVAVELEATEGGDVLAAVRETASDSSQLLAAVDRASKKMRNRLGESLRFLRSEPPLAQVTTGSLAALRKYTQASRLFNVGRRADAIRLYEEAVAIDTAFAAAHSALARAYTAYDMPGDAEAARRRAFQHRERLAFFERTMLLASHAHGGRDYETAIDAYNRLLERYPTDIRVLNNLALIHQDRRRFATAESLFIRAVAIDSTVSNLYFGVHGTQLLQGKFRESRATLDLIGRRFPGNRVLLAVEIQDAAAQQNWEVAERQAETLLAATPRDTLQLIEGYETLAGIVMAQGRLDEAERHWRTQLMLTAAAGSRGRHMFGVLQLARLHLVHRQAPARALAMLDSALAETPLDSLLPGDRPYDDLARFYASAGRVDRARALLADAYAMDSVLSRNADAEHAWTRGVIALADGHAATAESELRRAADGLACTICALPDLARAYEAANKPGAAVTVYEQYLSTPWFWRYETDAASLGWAMKRLAALYDARGESRKAAAIRTRLLQLWRHATPELQGVLAEERGRLSGG